MTRSRRPPSGRSRPGSRRRTGECDAARGQANLVALGAALFALTAVTVVGVAVADGALAGERRDAGERHAATAVADRLVAADSPLTARANVLDASAVTTLTAADLRRRYPVLRDREFRLSLGGEVLVSAGDPAGGTTMRRVVLVERTNRSTVVPAFRDGNRVTLPRRTPRARLDIDPPENALVRSVRANERTVLHDPDGLDGAYDVSLSRRETTRLTFFANASLERGDVDVVVFPRRTEKAQLVVTVDD